MDRFLKNWIDETIVSNETKMDVKISRIRIRDIIYAYIANYRAHAWSQSPSRSM